MSEGLFPPESASTWRPRPVPHPLRDGPAWDTRSLSLMQMEQDWQDGLRAIGRTWFVGVGGRR